MNESNTPSEPTVSEVRDTRSNPQLMAALILICTAVLVAVTWWLMPKGGGDTGASSVEITADTSTAEAPSARTQTISDIGEEPAFELTYAPTALTAIELSAPTEADLEADVEDYQARVSDVTLPSSAYAATDIAYELRFDDQTTFGNWLQSSDDAPVLYTLFDEIQYLASELDQTFAVAPLYERADGVEALTPIAANPFSGRDATVYPSQRAAAGFFVGEMMARIDPVNAEAYTAAVQDFVERGVLYGHYGAGSIAASETLVTQYIALVEAENPELLVNLTQ